MDPVNPDPFGGGPENWTLPDDAASGWSMPIDPWPPTDPTELARLNAWMDEQEALWEMQP